MSKFVIEHDEDHELTTIFLGDKLIGQWEDDEVLSFKDIIDTIRDIGEQLSIPVEYTSDSNIEP